MSTTLIVNGRIVDGTGNPWYYGDVLLNGESIEAIAPPGTISQDRAETIIDAKDYVIAPGFIDIQSHSILPLMLDGRSLSKITQGVTTEIMGEFWTPAPFGGKIEDQWAIALVHRLTDEDKAKWDEIARGWTRFGHWLRDLEQHGVSVNIGSSGSFLLLPCCLTFSLSGFGTALAPVIMTPECSPFRLLTPEFCLVVIHRASCVTLGSAFISTK